MTDPSRAALADELKAVDELFLELGTVTNGDGDPLDDEAIIFFAGDEDCSSEIRVSAPNALHIAKRLVKLWNARALPGRLDCGAADKTVEQILTDHFYTGEPGQRGAIKTAAKLLAPHSTQAPSDYVLHPLTEIREWDEALAILGIQESDQTPAEAIRELYSEIERLRALPQSLGVMAFATAILHGDDEHRKWLIEAAQAFIADERIPPARSALPPTLNSGAAPIGCKADFYALWCDDCRCHPSKCKLRTALPRAVEGGAAVYQRLPEWRDFAEVLDEYIRKDGSRYSPALSALVEVLEGAERSLSHPNSGDGYDPAFVEEIKRADKLPPEASFDNAPEMLAWLNKPSDGGVAGEPGAWQYRIREHDDWSGWVLIGQHFHDAIAADKADGRREDYELRKLYASAALPPVPGNEGREAIIEECATVAEGFDAACNSPRMQPFVDACPVTAIYKRDQEIGAAIRALAVPRSYQPCPSSVPGGGK